MLGKRHELHMRIMVVLDILNQFLSNLVILVPAFFDLSVRVVLPVRVLALPGAQMKFIDIERLVKVSGAVLHPLAVCEFKLAQIPDYRCEIGPELHTETIGVAVLHSAVLSVDHILVHLSRSGACYTDLIELRADRFHHLLFLPVIELADDHNLLRLRREGPEDYAVLLYMRTQILVRVIDIPHVELLKVHIPSFLLFILLILCCLYSESSSASSTDVSSSAVSSPVLPLPLCRERISSISCALSTVTLTKSNAV